MLSSFQNYPHPDDHTIRTTDTPGFKPFTKVVNVINKIDLIPIYHVENF